MKLSITLTRVVAIVTFCYPTLAQFANAQIGKGEGTTASSDQPKLVSEVVVDGRSAQDERKDSTTTKIVIDRSEIVQFGDRSLIEVMKRLPSITVINNQAGSEVRMRGLGAGYTRILIDGSPTSPNFVVDSIPPDSIARIEIMRAASAEIGAQAIAGTINIVLKKSVQRTGAGWNFVVATENDLPTFGVSTQITRRDGGLSFSVSGTVDQRKIGYRTYVYDVGSDADGTDTLLRTGYQAHDYTILAASLAPRISWTYDNDSLTADAFIGRRVTTGSQAERSNTQLGDPLTYASNDLTLRNPVTTVRGNLKWVRSFDNGAVFATNLGSTFDQIFSNAHLNGFDQEGRFNLERRVTSTATDKATTFGGKYSLPYTMNHDFSAGWDVTFAQRLEDRIQRDFSPVGIEPINIDESYDARVRRIAVFAQDEWRYEKHLSLYLGLRWEGLQTSSAGKMPDEVSNSSSVFSPLVQLMWRLPDTKNDRLRLALTRTYKPPQVAQLMPRRFVAKNNGPVTPNTQGNPDLRSELAWGLDAAYEASVGEKGTMSASAYARSIEDVIRQELFQQGGVWILRPINGGPAKVYGVEFDLKSPLTILSDALSLQINASRNWSIVKNVPVPDNRLDQQVPLSLNIGVQYSSRAPALTFGGNVSYQKGVRTQITDTRATRFGTARALDIFSVWKVSDQFSMRLTATGLVPLARTGQVDYRDASLSLRQSTFRKLDPLIKIGVELKL